MTRSSARILTAVTFLLLLTAGVAAYVLEGFQWPVGTNVSYRINANTPQVTNEANAVIGAADTWSALHPAGLRLTYQGTTTATTHAYNGSNTICWEDKGNSGALATAYMWYSGSTTLETDMVFNEYYNWSTSGATYDIETVALHELGHWVGLDHSTSGIMRPSYSGILRSVDSDARDGFHAMYGGGEPPPQPRIALAPTAIAFTGQQEKSFQVRNSGPDVLTYSLAPSRPWIQVAPGSGNSSGEWDEIRVAVDTSGMNPGIYSGNIAIQSGAADNSPQHVAVTLTVPDDKPPTISIQSPINKATLTGKPTVRATAKDDKGIQKVEFWVDGVLKAFDTKAPYTWVWNTLKYTSGSHNLMARAFDTIGQTAQVSIQVKIDHPPEVKIQKPLPGANLQGIEAVKANAADDIRIKNVRFYVNQELKHTDGTKPYTFNWNTGSYSNGSYKLKAVATDSGGQTAQDSVGVSVLPHAPSAFSGQRINNSSVLLQQYINRLTWQANPLNRDISLYRLYVSQGGEAWVVLSELGADSLGYDHKGVSGQGNYSYRLTAVDNSGLEGVAASLEIK